MTTSTARQSRVPQPTTVPAQPTSMGAHRALTQVEHRNDATMRRIYAEVFGQGRLDLLEDLMSPNAINYTAPDGQKQGTDPVRGLVTMLRSAFPDCRTLVEETLACGDTVVMRSWFEGTHLGPFLGHQPTGRPFRFRQIHWMRFGADGRVIEHWGVRDDVAHLQQLGLI